MMQKIRDKTSGIISWIIVGVIALAFCSWGVSSYIESRSAPPIAKVDDEIITTADVDDLYEHWIKYNSADKGFDASQIDPKIVKPQLAKSLAEERAVMRGLRKAGFAISENYLIETIQQQPNLQIDGKFSIDLYNRFLQQNRIEEAEFEDVQRDSLMLTQVQQGIVSTSFVLDKELQEIAKIRNQKRDFGYVIIPMANYEKTAEVNDADIAKFYEQYKDNFKEPQKVKIQYIELSIDDLMKNETVDDQKLRDYYKQNAHLFGEPELLHVRHIMIEMPKGASQKSQDEAKAKIDAIYKKLQQGSDFGALAKTDSQDKSSSSKGGDLGWIGKGDDALPPAVYTLNKKGEYTEPVQSDFGWHIFEIDDRKGGEVKDYNSVKNVVAARYKRDTAEKLFAAAGEDLANLSYENPNSLQPASDKLKLPIQSSEYFTQQSGAGIASSKNVRAAAFNDDVLGQQHNSDLIRISDDSYVVLRISDMQPERERPLEEVKPDIITMLKKQAAANKAKEVGEALVKSIKEGAAPAPAVAKLKLTWQTQKDAGRDNKATPSPILQNAFMIEKPTAEHPVTATGFQLPNGNFAVVGVTKIVPGVFDAATDQVSEEALKKQLSFIQGKLEFSSLQAALIAKAKIKYYEQ